MPLSSRGVYQTTNHQVLCYRIIRIERDVKEKGFLNFGI